MIRIHSIHIGQPQSLSDEKGTWRSSIFRQPVTGPIQLGERGLAGDQVTDTGHHGTPDQAVCCHSLEHYAYWNDVYGLETNGTPLGPGSVGENWTLVGANEAEICLGDVYTVGTARVQVSAPRFPCMKQERKLRLAGFQRRTVKTLRTGFYLRVLAPGTVQADDLWVLEERPHPGLTLHVANACVHHTCDAAVAERLIQTPDVAAGWRRIVERVRAARDA
jgi:MOSC domain-containing protein YiiM